MTKTIYFVRHGLTLSNTLNTLQGWSDTPLTKEGIHQAKCVGIGLSNKPISTIYTSTSERTYDTACLIKSDRNIPLIMCKGLKELNFGIKETQPNKFEGCTNYKELIFYPWDKLEGETFEMLQKRALETINSILEENEEGSSIVCVTHGIFILAILKLYDESVYLNHFDKEGFGNCSVTILEVNDGKYNFKEVDSMEYVKIGEDYEKNN